MRDLADFAVEYAVKLGADYAEARMQSDVGDIYILKNGNPEAAGFSREHGLGIRVLVKGGLGFVSINEPDKALAKKRIREAVEMAKASVTIMRKPIRLSPEKTVKKSWEVKPKIRFEDISAEEKMELLFDIDKTVSSPQEVGVSVPYRILQLFGNTTEKYFVNSEGTTISSSIPRVLFFALLTAYEKGGETDIAGAE